MHALLVLENGFSVPNVIVIAKFDQLSFAEEEQLVVVKDIKAELDAGVIVFKFSNFLELICLCWLIKLVDQNFFDRLLIFDFLNSWSKCKFLFIFGRSNMQNFDIFVPRRDCHFLKLLEIWGLKDGEGSLPGDDILMLYLKINSVWAFEVLRVDCHLEVVIVLSWVDSKTRLTTLVRDTISNRSAKHHHGALHIIVHWVFKSWLERFFVNQVEVNFTVCNNLNPNISSNEINLTSHVFELFIFVPKPSFLVDLEEKDISWWSSDESLIKEEIHGPKIRLSDLLVPAFHRFGINSDAVSLSVEGSALSRGFAVKRLDREVQLWALRLVDFSAHYAGGHLWFKIWVHKVVLLLLHSVVNTNKDRLVRKDWCSNERLIKPCDRLWIWINMRGTCYIKIINDGTSWLQESHTKFAIILVGNHKNVTSNILLNKIDLHKLSFKRMIEDLFICW